MSAFPPLQRRHTENGATTSASTPWQTSSIASSTQRQNLKLSTLLAIISRMTGGEPLTTAGMSDMEAAINHDASFESMNLGAGFERNFLEIQKLLERARASEDDGEIGGLMSTDPDRERRRKKQAAVAAVVVNNNSSVMGGASGSNGNSSQHVAALKSNLFDMTEIGGESKGQVGRKPLRVIAADLAKRIDQLKSNQTEWETFQARILDYQKTQTVQADIIRYNKSILNHYVPESRQKNLADIQVDHRFHRMKVLEKKKELDTEKLRRKLETVRKKDAIVESGKRREKEEMGRAQLMQKKWFIVVASLSRVLQVAKTVEESQIRQERIRERNHAATVIQKGWRDYSTRKLEYRKRQAMEIIAKVFSTYVRKRRIILKNKAADIIRQFFKEVHDVSKLMKIVKKYRFSVIKAQILSRSFLAVRNAQVTVICKLWDKLENGWWAQRKLHSEKNTNASNMSIEEKVKTPKSKKKGKKGKDDDKEKASERTAIKVSDATKIAVVLEDLIIRRRAYRQALQDHKEVVTKWNTEHRHIRLLLSNIKPKAGDSAPKKPVFKLLPAQPEMYALIEKGFMQFVETSR
ncbi:hypothetical protein HK101_009354 [Irineochytrium annulatum]|nr:hypothetical protein HK101_009354 [Irineochytrium annulatum]